MWNNENIIKSYINNINVVWGGFSVSSATINRFFSLHFTLPFILAALVVGHLLYLHVSGSSNPIGTTSNADRTAFHPYFSFKDLVTVYLFFIIFTIIVFYSPDKLGHSDNYIEANSMQTPASIKLYWIFMFIIFIFNNLYIKLLNFNIWLNNHLRLINFTLTGKNFKNKVEILKLIEILKLDKELFLNNNFNDFEFSNNFKYLANGIFQAEGHIGGYFIKSKSLIFRPMVFIGITVNIESLKFLVLLNSQFNSKMQYSIEKLPSGLYFIKLYSRDWNFIVNNFIPYFDKLYGDKNKGLKRLEKLYLLLSEYKKKSKLDNYHEINILIEKVILLAYNLIDNCKRKNLISNYFSLYNIVASQTIDFFEIEENKELINNYFLLGLILGDGNLYVRIRESKNLPWFIPNIRIGQKVTRDNFLFLNNIKNTLLKNEISSSVSKIGHLYVISINQIDNVVKFSKWLPDDSNLWFWKKKEYLILKKALLLMKLKATYWQKGKEIILDLVYKISKYNKPISYWQKIMIDYYTSDLKRKDIYYISLWRNKAWSVKLPIKSKPKVKFFFFKTYNSKEEALLEAKIYRNQKLNQWLKENKLIK